MVEPFREFGAALLEHQPEFTIDRISVSTPEGKVQLSGKVSIPGFARADMQAGPLALLPKLEASMDVAIDEGFLNRDWGSPAAPATVAAAPAPTPATPPSRIEAMKAQLHALEQQGFVSRHGSQLSSHLEFHRGALTVNGKPMGPPAAR